MQISVGVCGRGASNASVSSVIKWPKNNFHNSTLFVILTNQDNTGWTSYLN